MSLVIKEIHSPPLFEMVESDQTLFDVCQKAAQCRHIALDTEFIRIRTFYPKLGLIQLYDGQTVSLIDPSKISDFSPFIQLLANPRIVKVLHACKEDLEIFHHYFQQVPTPIVDTQVVAHFLGLGASAGFAGLVEHFFQLKLDKGASRTDWLARPLSDSQCRYAAADVWYLLPLHQQLDQQLAQSPWQGAVQFECENLVKNSQQSKSADMAYLDIANSWRLNAQELMRLKLLAKWRYDEAIKRDLALNFVVKAEHLWLLAKNDPKNTSQLLELGLTTAEVRIHGKKMLQILDKARRSSVEDYPATISRLADDERYRPALKALQHCLKEITPANLPADVLATKRSLEELMKWCWIKQQDPNQLPLLLQGWRAEYGQKLLQSLQNF
ncbi:ribonuclease D [Avibacterium avium]|uniref:Ribonuclease D n=1 Tax=Avibacterium avium TaxID=751 RepID=A0A379ASC7_AVIAV|nr:ribonuclease D [Avibacterium avium]SUB24598.1 ribonuclease D [Avibacterium avium]